MKPLKRKRAGAKKVTQPVDAVYPELDNLREAYKQSQIEALESRHRSLSLESAILTFCKEHGIEKYSRGPGRSLTPVEASTEHINWEELRKQLKPAQWKRLLGAPQPDKAKLAALVETGEIDASIVSACVTYTLNKPYVRLT